MRKFAFLLLIVILSACRPVGVTSTVLPATEITTAVPTQTALPSPTPSPTPIPPTSTPTEETFTICSPLEEETFDSLPLILVNPLVEPYAWGTDFGHPGLDFAYYQRGDRLSIEGIEVYAILAGKVTLILDDLYPYGYAVVIETPLSALPEDLQQSLMAGYGSVPEDLEYQYNCPNVPTPTLTGEYSLYHLYAHLQVQPEFELGEEINCGQLLGNVGNSGWSSNPHLHLETRIGPSELEITSMAHYETTATEEQLSNYCLWRSSGYYQIVDPFTLFEATP